MRIKLTNIRKNNFFNDYQLLNKLLNTKIKLVDRNGSINIDKLRERIYTSNSLIVISGSLVEEIGSIYSDLDICVLCDSIPSIDSFNQEIHNTQPSIHNARKINTKRGSWSTHDYWKDKGLQVDIEYHSKHNIKHAIGKLNLAYNNMISIDKIEEAHLLPEKLDHDDKELLHRMLTGFPINNFLEYEELIRQIPINTLCFAYYKWSHLKYADFKDILGAIYRKSFDMAIFLISKAIRSQMKALLHLLGCTNDKEKWVITYSNFMPIELDEVRLTLLRLLNANLASKKKREEYILHSFDFIDRIYNLCCWLIDTNFPSVPRSKLFSYFAESYSSYPYHRQIHRQLAYTERFYSRNTISLKSFLNFDKPLTPLLEYK